LKQSEITFAQQIQSWFRTETLSTKIEHHETSLVYRIARGFKNISLMFEFEPVWISFQPAQYIPVTNVTWMLS